MKYSFFKYFLYSFVLTVFMACSTHYSQNQRTLNLSGKNLDSIPDLSKSNDVTELDLSGNHISFWDEKKLPPNITRLDLSHNVITGPVKITSKGLPKLYFIDLSHNKIEKFYSFSYSLDTIKVSHNQIKNLMVANSDKVPSEKKIGFLDISGNKELSNALNFPPFNIKMIKREGILNNEELYFKLGPKPKK